ncbi:MAG: type II restriction endonuclease [Schwartzia sp.]|nr:type II restriction endonuclease [Schwartzia sp. (in: firmicutes)]
MLELENPGCFDEPDKTFVDLYMKSGLYITEIVKRLFQSKKMKEAFPDEKERLRHIFKNQVYGLAPTEIIYKIATSYILGFDESLKLHESEHNFRQLDALPYAKAGTLEKKLDEVFGKPLKRA